MAVDDTVFGNSHPDELSESELEQYGVWVKSGPEDVEEEGEHSMQLEDFSADELEDSARSFMEDEPDAEHGDDLDEDFQEVPVFSDEEEDLLAELERSDSHGAVDTDDLEIDSFDLQSGKSYGIDIDESSYPADQDQLLDEVATDAEEFGSSEPPQDLEQEFDAVEPETAGLEEELQLHSDEMPSDDPYYPSLDANSLPDDDDADDFDDIEIDIDSDSTIPELELEDHAEAGVADLSVDEEALLRDDEYNGAAPDKDDEMDQAAYRLLEQIQEEIATMKTELHEVREGLMELRARTGGALPSGETSPVASEDQSTATPDTSDINFFDEDEDETIALTGDELDNILNTADFVETTGEPTPVDDAVESPEIEIDDANFEQEALNTNAEDEDDVFDMDISTEDDIIPLDPPPEDSPTDTATPDSESDFELDEQDEISIDVDLDDALDEADADEDTSDSELDLDNKLELDDDLDLSDLESELDSLDEEEVSLPSGVESSDEDVSTDSLDDIDVGGLSDQHDFTDDEEPEIATDEAPIEEITLDEPEDELETEETPVSFPGDEHLSIDDDDESTDGLDTLAQLDIDSELADIDALKDTPDDTLADTSEIDNISIELPEDEDDDLQLEDTELDLDSGSESESAESEDLEPDDDDLQLEDTELDLDDLDLDKELDLDEESEDETELELPNLDDTLAAVQSASESDTELSDDLRDEIRAVLRYMDQLLESLPEDKIQEFASSEHFEVYKKLFEELGLET